MFIVLFFGFKLVGLFTTMVHRMATTQEANFESVTYVAARSATYSGYMAWPGTCWLFFMFKFKKLMEL
jgi:hypothetical protein